MRLLVRERPGGDGLRRVCSALRRRGFAIQSLAYSAEGASITVDVRVEETRSHLVRPTLLKVIDVLDVEEV